MGDFLGDFLSTTRGQIRCLISENPENKDILSMGEHTHTGSTPVISTNDNPMK